jgi:hypothetical protein
MEPRQDTSRTGETLSAVLLRSGEAGLCGAVTLRGFQNTTESFSAAGAPE